MAGKSNRKHKRNIAYATRRKADGRDLRNKRRALRRHLRATRDADGNFTDKQALKAFEAAGGSMDYLRNRIAPPEAA